MERRVPKLPPENRADSDPMFRLAEVERKVAALEDMIDGLTKPKPKKAASAKQEAPESEGAENGGKST